MRKSRFVASLLALLLAPILWGQQYQLHDLGVVPGEDRSMASGVNDFGQVSGGGSQKGFRWDVLTGFTTFQLGTSNEYGGINNGGQIVGWSFQEGIRSAYVWDSATGFHVLGSDATGHGSEAYGINDSGQVAGRIFTTNGQAVAAFYDPVSGWQRMGQLALPTSVSYGLNNLGQAVGEGYDSEGRPRPFLWSSLTGLVDLGVPSDAIQGTAWDVNDSGAAIGWYALQDFSLQAWYRKPDGQVLRLQGLNGPGESVPYGINSEGDVVGYYTNSSGVFGYLWSEQDGMRDLRSLTVGGLAGYSRVVASGISDTGYISATGTIGGQPHALRFDPVVPEPSTLAFSALGFLGLKSRRRAFLLIHKA